MSVEQPDRRRGPFAVEVTQLYASIGEAVWHLQHLEDALSSSLALKIDLKNAAPGSVRPEVAGRALADRRRLTLGQAVKVAHETAIYDERLQRRLTELLKERNWLVHRLVHESAGDMNTDRARAALYGRIGDISAAARALHKAVGDDLMAFAVSKGLDQARIEQRALRDFLQGRGLA